MTSTVKVDNVQKVSDASNIIKKCGTTITLGASGDTISLASGASQTGFGRTGTVDWITTPKTNSDSPVTAVSGKGYFLNTTAGTITVNLPAGSAGDIVSFADYAATWDTYKVTLTPNGTDKIGGVNDTADLNTIGQSVTFVYVDSVQGWVNTMDSTSNVRGSAYMTATVSGACNTLVTAPDCANFKVATFKNPGTFCVSTIAPCATFNLVSYMVIGGGGGGGRNDAGAGGAGGYREVISPTSPYSGSPLDGYPTVANRITVSASPYPICVGGGGPEAPVSNANGVNGTASTFSTITSAGGGGGGSETGPRQGSDGGSGGGGGAGGGSSGPGASGNTPPTSPPQGQDGGDGNVGSPSSTARAGGGGGGAGGAGAVGSGGGPAIGGAGGAGTTSSIDGSATTRASGGSGGARNQSQPATPGGGGAGGSSSIAGGNGQDYTGGGGGGAGEGSPCVGGNGGSGIVIIRYRFQ